MRTLNRGVAFVLVLFGSVVPASAQDLQGYAGVVQTVVVSVSVVFGVVITLLAFWWKFDARLDQTNRRIDDAKKELKADAQKAHAEIATSIRESEKRLNDSIDKVRADMRESEKRLNDNISKLHANVNDNISKLHATVQLLLEQAIRGRDHRAGGGGTP